MSIEFWAGFVAGWMALNFLCLVCLGLAVVKLWNKVQP